MWLIKGGTHFIKYLNAGHYLGIDKNRSWVEAGIQNELGKDLYEEKIPEFVITDKFEFKKFSKKPDFAIAQSLFTHLRKKDIALCLKKLREHVNAGCRLYATFFESNVEKKDKGKSHSHRNFHYTKQQMCELGEQYRWKPKYIGNWQHPSGQMMMEFIAI